MIVKGFRPVMGVAAVGGAALGCYMLSLQVAAERGELAELEGRIVETQRSIRALQTELGTRGRLQQLERWNGEVLALSAPVAHQYLDSNVSLARFDVRQRSFEARAAVRMASAPPPPPAAAPAPAEPPVRLASAPQESVELPGRPILRPVSLLAGPAATPVRVAARQRPPGLLDESTLSDLSRRSRSEGDEGTRN